MKDDLRELGRDKCGVMLWTSPHARVQRPKTHYVLDLGDDDGAESVLGDDEVLDSEEMEFQHAHYIYSAPEGVIPTVDKYKYLGITMDKRLGDPRKIVPGERSMELEFAHSQAAKGSKKLHALRPFLTDRFCPIGLKVALVRNLIYPVMLYGSELIGFQRVHAEPMQRIINTAAKWILGLHKSNTNTDAFSLCLELGFPPIFQEQCAMRARLAAKLGLASENGFKTWIKTLWDNPPTLQRNHQTWVTLTKKWLKGIEKDKCKYSRALITDENGELVMNDGDIVERTIPDRSAPLRHWAQLGKALEMRVRSNSYNSPLMQILMSAMIGETEYGEPVEAPTFCPEMGDSLFTGLWDPVEERGFMDNGRAVPTHRTRKEVTQVALVRDVVLERLMSSQKTKGFQFYDMFGFGVTRGFIREATQRVDLAEGVRWLCLARTHAFPTVEGAWQRAVRGGRRPGFYRNRCPLCLNLLIQNTEWLHLLTECTFAPVEAARETFLMQSISYFNRTTSDWEAMELYVSSKLGLDRQNSTAGVVAIFLLGGVVRWSTYAPLITAYQMGYGQLKRMTPGFDMFHFSSVASFFQVVAPLFVGALKLDLYGDWSSTGSQSGSSSTSAVNQEHTWLPGADEEPVPTYESEPEESLESNEPMRSTSATSLPYTQEGVRV